MILLDRLSKFPRIELLGGVTPIQKLKGLSRIVGREIYVKRDDTAPIALAFGGNKLRKLEYLAADALRVGANTLVTAGAVQSNHVRQTAAVAAHLGLRCNALLCNPTSTGNLDYLRSGNRLLVDLFGAETEMVETLDGVDQRLQVLAARLQLAGRRPYVVPVGGSNPLGVLGYVRGGFELRQQAEAMGIDFSAIVLASGSAGTHGGLAIALGQSMPATQIVGVTVSRMAATQMLKVAKLTRETLELLGVGSHSSERIELWDEYLGPQYGECSEDGVDAIRLLARTEGLLLDPVYTGKAMAGLLGGIKHSRFNTNGPLLFLHTGGAPALFGYGEAMSRR